ncbi:peptide IlvX [Phytobacter sp. AG2a]
MIISTKFCFSRFTAGN